MSVATAPIYTRPLDFVYFIYFATHIPVTILIDLQAIYPPTIVPQALKNALAFYVDTFKDPFMGSKTPQYWFLSLIACEAAVQLPFFFWACRGLLKNSVSIRLPLAVYGAHVATTVLPVLGELFLNPEFRLEWAERCTLSSLYLPYLILPLVMVIDSYVRLKGIVKRAFEHTKVE